MSKDVQTEFAQLLSTTAELVSQVPPESSAAPLHGGDAFFTGGENSSYRPKGIPLDQVICDGRYRLEKMLGQGGMGSVHLATDMIRTRKCALKTVPVRQELMDLFYRELEALERLSHDNIVRYFGEQYDPHLQQHFLIMEYIEGCSLQELFDLSWGFLEPHRKSDFGRMLLKQIASALDYVHSKKIIHCDLKPANVMLPQDSFTPKLIDFGIAFSAMPQGETRLTQRGVLGTVFYSAPELLLGRKATYQADVFSLGALAYQLLTGEVPMGIPAPPHLLNEHLPSQIDSVIFKAMAADPSTRFKSCGEFYEALEQAFNPVQEPQISITEPAPTFPAPIKCAADTPITAVRFAGSLVYETHMGEIYCSHGENYSRSFCSDPRRGFMILGEKSGYLYLLASNGEVHALSVSNESVNPRLTKIGHYERSNSPFQDIKVNQGENGICFIDGLTLVVLHSTQSANPYQMKTKFCAVDQPMSAPVIFRKNLYYFCKSGMAARPLDRLTAGDIIQVDIQDPIGFQSFGVQNELIFMAGETLYAFNMKDHNLDPITSFPELKSILPNGDEVLVHAGQNHILSLNPFRNIVNWHVSLDGELQAPPFKQRKEPLIYCALRDGTCVALNRKTGETHFTMHLPFLEGCRNVFNAGDHHYALYAENLFRLP